MLALTAVLAFVSALAASLALTPLVRALARRFRLPERPGESHRGPDADIPRVGGLAVYLAFLGGSLLAWGVAPVAFLAERDAAGSFLPLLVATAAVMVLGLLDDLVGVRPASKLAVQVAAATYLYLSGYSAERISNPLGEGAIDLGVLALPLNVLWLVAMSNAINLIDGLDGLAAGVAFVATGTFSIAAWQNGHPGVALLALALAGALLGFLRFNFNPASIFLGDSGSLFVGLSLGALALRSSTKASATLALAVPLMALALPLFDVTLAVARRFARGRDIFAADRDHIHHRLLGRGLTPRRAAVVLYGVSALAAVLALGTLTGRSQAAWAGAAALSVLAFAAVRQLGYAELGEFQRVLVARLLPDRRLVSSNADMHAARERLRAARGLGELWDALVDLSEALGVDRVELVTHDEVLLDEWRRQRPRRAFPAWSASARHPSWSWSVRLGCCSVELGLDPGGGFDCRRFVALVTEEFGSGVERLFPRFPRARAG